MLICNFFIPALTRGTAPCAARPGRDSIVTLLVNVGMYCERLTIIPMTLAHGRSPFDWGELRLGFVDVAIPLGSMCFFIFLLPGGLAGCAVGAGLGSARRPGIAHFAADRQNQGCFGLRVGVG